MQVVKFLLLKVAEGERGFLVQSRRLCLERSWSLDFIGAQPSTWRIFSLRHSPSHLVLSLFCSHKRHPMGHDGHGVACAIHVKWPAARMGHGAGSSFAPYSWVSMPGLDAKLSQPTQEM